MTPSKILFYFCIAFIAGIALNSIIKIPQIFLWGFLLLGIFSIIVSFFYSDHSDVIRKFGSLLGFCLFFLVLGIARIQASEFTIAHDALVKLNDSPEKITLAGTIISEPDVRESFQKLKVKVDGTKSVLLVTAARYPEYRYLDRIKVTGKLKNPPEFEDFNYRNYLMKDGIYSLMDFPKVELIDSKHSYNVFSFFYEKVLFFKSTLTKSIHRNFMPPQSFIMEGFIFGNDKNMPKDLKEKFNATGLSHLTAVSGSNIVILLEILIPTLLFLGLWRGQAFYFALALVWVYILMIGLPVSAVRAGIMGSAGLLAQKFGRQNTSSRAIVITASMMLLQNPLLLLHDIGFQLSFLASMGIMHAKPFMDYAFSFIVLPKDKIRFLFDAFSITIAAQVFTLPVILYHFGAISWISPLANVLVVPLIPLATILGFLAALAGVFSHILGFVLSIPCQIFLSYFLTILDLFYQPWAAMSISHVSWLWVVAYYLLLAVSIRYLDKFLKPKFLGC